MAGLLKSEHHPATGDFLSNMNSVGHYPLVALPTRITPSSATLIDNIFTNDFCRPISSGLVFTSISDHLPAFAILGDAGSNLETGPQYFLKREMGIRNKEKFRKWAKNWSERFTLEAGSVAESAMKFRNELWDGYNGSFPQKKVKIRYTFFL